MEDSGINVFNVLRERTLEFWKWSTYKNAFKNRVTSLSGSREQYKMQKEVKTSKTKCIQKYKYTKM